MATFVKPWHIWDRSGYLSKSLICGLRVGFDRASIGLKIESWQDLLAAPDGYVDDSESGRSQRSRIIVCKRVGLIVVSVQWLAASQSRSHHDIICSWIANSTPVRRPIARIRFNTAFVHMESKSTAFYPRPNFPLHQRGTFNKTCRGTVQRDSGAETNNRQGTNIVFVHVQMCFHRQMLPNVRFPLAPSH